MEYIVKVRPQNVIYQRITPQSSNKVEHTNFECLAKQLNKKDKIPNYWIYSSAISVIILMVLILIYDVNSPQVLSSLILFIFFNIGIYFFTTLRKKISLIYSFLDEQSAENYLDQLNGIKNITKSKKKWFVTSNLLDPTPKYTSIARYCLTYKKLKIRRIKSTTSLRCNLDFYTIKSNKNLFIFLPDQLLVKTVDGYISKPYTDLITKLVFYRRIEKLKNIPKDTQILAPVYYEHLEKHLKKKFRKTDKLFLVQYRMRTLQLRHTNIYEQLIFSSLKGTGFMRYGLSEK
ncbi:hypothetical protein OZX61_07490 [Acinetobacter sp. ESL0695]|uniref:hypothetical protein n=1 Tax=Acinetobacter sp. ESL0695 TaxID=2983215 RepID=UPI0023F22C2A|nr:hypothetical protein [Acinetobacter sp. ESL0695]WEV48133.1 hypothetical protein OZX61_07490 [Acinetobacter sp. ESL0695]